MLPSVPCFSVLCLSSQSPIPCTPSITKCREIQSRFNHETVHQRALGPCKPQRYRVGECYYFYISLHLSLILKQFSMFLSCPCTCTCTRSRVRGVSATVTQQSQREFSVRDSGPEKRPGLGITCLGRLWPGGVD